MGQAARQSHFWESSLSLSLFLVFSSLAIPQFELLSLLSSLRLSSGHSGLVLTLSTDYADHTSLSSPYMLVADTSFWVTSPLAVTVGHIWCVAGFFFFVLFCFVLFVCFSPVMLPSEIPKLPKDLPVREFPPGWKLHLLHSFPRMSYHP